MAEPWFLQMTAYAIMVEELTGHEIEECIKSCSSRRCKLFSSIRM